MHEEILQELIRKWEIDTAIRLQEDNHKNIFPVVEKPFQAVQDHFLIQDWETAVE